MAPSAQHATDVPCTFVLDTDIGTDVDDLLALSMIFGSPRLTVAAVTTVYGDVALRARIVAKACAVGGVTPPPIAVGLSRTLSGREVWWPGHEGSTIADLDEQTYASPESAHQLLTGSATIAAIGPLTNIAAAVSQPGHRVEQIVMMGGDFARDIVEHNIRCDVAAANVVFSSGVPVLAVGFEQTERVRLERAELERIGAAGPLGALVSAEMQRFWDFASQDYNVPHDPIAVLTLTRPDLFEISRGLVTVHANGDREGITTFTPGADGPHSIVTDMNVDAVASEITDRIVAAAAVGAASAAS